MFRSLVCLIALFLASPAVAQIAVTIERPTRAPVARTFAVQGTAPGADVVHVWAFPPDSDPVFLGEGWLDAGRFELTATAAPLGTYPLVVYAHDPETGTFIAQKSVTVTVRRSPTVASGFGAAGATIPANDLDDAFLVMPSGESSEGGVIAFGQRWPSPPVCIGQGAGEHVVVTATRDEATVILYAMQTQQAPIRIHCRGGK